MSDDNVKFDLWMEELNCDVIQDEYGYEPGEFQAFPELWFPLYEEGLTPSEAFKRALRSHRSV